MLESSKGYFVADCCSSCGNDPNNFSDKKHLSSGLWDLYWDDWENVDDWDAWDATNEIRNRLWSLVIDHCDQEWEVSISLNELDSIELNGNQESLYWFHSCFELNCDRKYIYWFLFALLIELNWIELWPDIFLLVLFCPFNWIKLWPGTPYNIGSFPCFELNWIGHLYHQRPPWKAVTALHVTNSTLNFQGRMSVLVEGCRTHKIFLNIINQCNAP